MSEVHLIEQDIADTRARLSETIDRIQDKLTVSGIVDEVMGQAGVPRLESGHGFVLGFLKRHPVPVMIAAAGIGWFMYRRNSRAARTAAPGTIDLPALSDLPVVNDGRAHFYDPDTPSSRPGSGLPRATDDVTA